MRRVVAIIQARLKSTRLPAKVLLDLGGVTVLERCVRRVRRFRQVAEVVIATSDTPGDEIIERVGQRLGLQVIRGSENDVLARYVLAAERTKADVIVRVTSDCPLIDPEVSSLVIDRFLEDHEADYASNVMERRLPRGLDTEVMSAEALLRAHREASDPAEREHVTAHIYRRPQSFKCLSVAPPAVEDLSAHRWTLDTVDDFRFLHAVFSRMGEGADSLSIPQILDVIGDDASLLALNAAVVQKQV
ncbi:MAG: glycosyltransferase family protein [Myxococcaceae bacterium]|nr:glycosyltransferase family protein [Myxococcaceae bacterium]MCA3012340.1 glycosyltransferase family protein [Myxococcaceae bacterium]